MSKLNYKKNDKIQHLLADYENNFQTIDTYNVTSMYESEAIREYFLDLKTNIVDFNRSLVTKCVQGTENDFKKLMDKASEYLNISNRLSEGNKFIVLSLFQQCVFGFYILTPLIEEEEVSDIKVYSWNHITCKVRGDRYLTNLSFADEADYDNWFDRFLRIHRLYDRPEDALNRTTDIKGSADSFLRIDVQLSDVTSDENYNLHIRKIPKEKYTWEYLKNANMLNDDMIRYLRDRIVSGYGFLLSGKGGSGKTALLNNMIDLIPFQESILVSQESDELYSTVHPQLQMEHPLIYEKNGEKKFISLEDELELGLLQDIDDFIVGEIKGGEALYVFTTAASTGARFFGTIHSNTAASSPRRLAHCAKFISNYSVETLEEMLTSTPFCLIHLTHFSIDEILEIKGWDEEKQKLEFISVYNKFQPVDPAIDETETSGTADDREG